MAAVTDYHINVFFSDEDGGWIADIPDLPGVSAFGETPEAAVSEVVQAKELWIASMRDAGNAIPDPSYRPTFR